MVRSGLIEAENASQPVISSRASQRPFAGLEAGAVSVVLIGLAAP